MHILQCTECIIMHIQLLSIETNESKPVVSTQIRLHVCSVFVCAELSTLAWNFPRWPGRSNHRGREIYMHYMYVYSIRPYLRRTCIGTIKGRDDIHSDWLCSSHSLHPLPCTCSEQHKRNCCDRYLRIQVAQRAGTLCKRGEDGFDSTLLSNN